MSILSRQDAKGDFPLVVTNPGDLPLYDVTLVIAKWSEPFNEVTIPISVLPPKETLPHRLNLDVPLDQYIILIHTRATPLGFFETLKLIDNNGQLHQSYDVRRIDNEKQLMDVP